MDLQNNWGGVMFREHLAFVSFWIYGGGHLKISRLFLMLISAESLYSCEIEVKSRSRHFQPKGLPNRCL